MKVNKKHKIIIISLLVLPILLLGACSNPQSEDTTEEVQNESIILEEDIAKVDEVENTSVNDNSTSDSEISPQTNAELSSYNYGLTEEEIDSLIFMREEEKLAKDVYLGLYNMWGLSIFQNIANSEQTHTDAVKHLLDIFEIEDPADTSPTGIFANTDLQELYDELIRIGSQSLGDALKVGAAIEEIDILDLQEYLEITQNESIRQVYENLLNGSKNHLRSFTSILERQTGEIYEPQYLEQADYDAILGGSSQQTGRGNANRP